MGRTTRCSDLRLRHHCATLGAQLWAHELVHYGLCRPRLCTLRQVKTSAVSQCDGFDGRQCVFPALQSTVSSSLCLDSILVSFTHHSLSYDVLSVRLETHARILLNSMRTLSWMSFDVCFKRPRKQSRTPRNSQVRSHSHSHVTGSGQYRYRTHRGKRVSEMKGVSTRTSTSFSWSMNMGIKFGSYSFWARLRPVITG